MARISQQPVPEVARPFFKQAGVKIKNYKSTVSFERDLKNFIARNHVLHLGTTRNRVPRVTPLEFRSSGLVFYILSEGGGKFINLRENRKVCFSIAEPYDSQKDFFGNKGLQAWGTAKVYSLRDQPGPFRAALKKMNAAKGAAAIAVENLLPKFHYRIIEIVPDKIKYGNPREGIFHITWLRK